MLLRLLQALCGLVVWGRCLQAAAAEPALPQKSSRTAYVSLLYGTTFVEAARVLGYSIRLTSSRWGAHLLCSYPVISGFGCRQYIRYHGSTGQVR